MAKLMSFRSLRLARGVYGSVKKALNDSYQIAFGKVTSEQLAYY
jgi:hypothetical protein